MMIRLLLPWALVAVSALPSLGQIESDDRLPERLDYMRQMVQSFTVTPLNQAAEGLATQFHENAMLRFGDPTREASDGSLWKLGEGRPEVVVATEFTRTEVGFNLNYEFLCLTPIKFTLTTTHGWRWSPAGSAMTFKPLKSRMKPGPTANARLRQMRLLVRRFTASELYNGETYRLRLMPQPIDIYTMDHKSGAGEGAVFVFANGTNPEVLLLVEAIDQQWRYGLARLCGASPTVKLDEEVVWTKPSMEQVGKSWRLDYTGEAHAVEDAP